jgi:hypothetical protein
LALVEDISPEILSCIESGISVFGKTAASMVLWDIRRQMKLNRYEISQNPEVFSESLNRIFAAGSYVIERRVVSEIVMKFKLPERDYTGIADAINEIKKRERYPG